MKKVKTGKIIDKYDNWQDNLDWLNDLNYPESRKEKGYANELLRKSFWNKPDKWATNHAQFIAS